MRKDVEQLQRRLDTLVRAATRIRTHCPDLYGLGWDPYVGEVENVAGSKPESKPPASGDPRARRLYDRITQGVADIEAELLGLDRQMMATFTARSERPEPTRGSMISVAEHDARIVKQDDNRAQGHYVPARLEEQPAHPGKRRR